VLALSHTFDSQFATKSEAVWAAMEGTGWRPVSQIAIDEVWSALRFRPTEDVKSRKGGTGES
jgi:hypothetical protein